MTDNLYRVWMRSKWVTFPASCLDTDPLTLNRWTDVLEAEAACHPEDEGRGRGANDTVAEYLGGDYNGEMVRWILTRIRAKVRLWERLALNLEQVKAAPAVTVDEQVDRWRELIGSSQVAAAHVRQTSDTRTVIVIADIHGHPHPSLLPAVIEEAQTYPEDGVEIVIVGDLYNVFATVPAQQVLRDPARGASILKTEEANLVAMIEVLVTALPHCHITIIPGNHDQIVKLFEADNAYAVIQVLTAWLGTTLDPITRLSELYEQVDVGGWNIDYHEANGTIHPAYHFNRFVHRIGQDVLVSHTNETGANAHRSLYNWVQDHRYSAGLADISIVLQAHVHRATLEALDGGHTHVGCIGFGGAVTTSTYQFDYALWPSQTVPAFVVLQQYEDEAGWWTFKQGALGPRIRFL